MSFDPWKHAEERLWPLIESLEHGKIAEDLRKNGWQSLQKLRSTRAANITGVTREQLSQVRRILSQFGFNVAEGWPAVAVELPEVVIKKLPSGKIVKTVARTVRTQYRTK